MFSNAAIKAEADELRPYVQNAYRRFHRFPELSRHEIQTNRIIREMLGEMKIPYFSPKENITVAVITGEKGGAVVGLRCETDALPIQEETGLPFASENAGVMHACGHDAHMAVGLGAARILRNHRAELHGVVKIIFQPAEEGEAGADDVIATGLVNDVDIFFALHLWSPYPSGTLHLSPITVSAAVNMFTVRVHGRGGHGATPEKCADAVAAGAAVVSALQSIVSRRLSPMEHALVTVGSFQAGKAGNVIAGEAELKGTFRTLNEETRMRVSELLEKDAQHAAALYGCTAEIENRRMSDPVVNDQRACALARASAEGLAASDRIGPQKTMMLGDDFANYGVIAPYFYGQVGIADPAKQTDVAHHNGRFRVDEDVLPLAVAWMASFGLRAGETWKT